ncbi:MAG: hypothetical protein LBF36_02125 [Mycoplasmataceae bacterium]|nr:hypothetical protein [Mycoplasmataceae bacterium]
METRLERYRIYRNEIINEGVLLDRLVDETNISKQYKTKIDALDSNILANINENKSLAKLISVNQNEMIESKQMVDFLNLIDEKKISDISVEINEWSSKHQIQPIIDSKGNISMKWLIEDLSYSQFKNNWDKIQIQNTSWAKFQVDSKSQISKINELSQLADNGNAIAELQTITTYSDNKKNYNKIIYIIPSMLSVLFLIAIIALLVIIITRL